MKLNIYQVDAFTNQLFHGNPAAVVPLEKWLPDEVMQNIAAENNLSETAFTVPKGNDFELRWFTPAIEVRLCGHATLATAHIYFDTLHYDQPVIHFHTKSGRLSVEKQGSYYVMNFPADTLQEVNTSDLIIDGLRVDQVKQVYKGQDDYLVILDTEHTIRQLQPDFRILSKLKARGIIATAKGNTVDFVSRCFFPQVGIDEDPVTGSAHTTLTPYWAERLGKQELTAQQLSQRSGELRCTLKGNRVLLKGQAVLYLKGEIEIDDE